MNTKLDFGTFEDRTGINSQFFEPVIKQVADEMQAVTDPLAVVRDAYPRIHKMITQNWGTALLHLKLTKLVALDTEGREGFTKPVGLALMRIHSLHMEKFGFEPIWSIPGMKKDTW